MKKLIGSIAAFLIVLGIQSGATIASAAPSSPPTVAAPAGEGSIDPTLHNRYETPSSSGFVYLTSGTYKYPTGSPAFFVSGVYVGEYSAITRLERLIEIQDDVYDWITVADHGVLVQQNGIDLNGIDLGPESGHLTLQTGDTFMVTQVGETVAFQHYRLSYQIGGDVNYVFLNQ